MKSKYNKPPSFTQLAQENRALTAIVKQREELYKKYPEELKLERAQDSSKKEWDYKNYIDKRAEESARENLGPASHQPFKADQELANQTVARVDAQVKNLEAERRSEEAGLSYPNSPKAQARGEFEENNKQLKKFADEHPLVAEKVLLNTSEDLESRQNELDRFAKDEPKEDAEAINTPPLKGDQKNLNDKNFLDLLKGLPSGGQGGQNQKALLEWLMQLMQQMQAEKQQMQPQKRQLQEDKQQMQTQIQQLQEEKQQMQAQIQQLQAQIQHLSTPTPTAMQTPVPQSTVSTGGAPLSGLTNTLSSPSDGLHQVADKLPAPLPALSSQEDLSPLVPDNGPAP